MAQNPKDARVTSCQRQRHAEHSALAFERAVAERVIEPPRGFVLVRDVQLDRIHLPASEVALDVRVHQSADALAAERGADVVEVDVSARQAVRRLKLELSDALL